MSASSVGTLKPKLMAQQLSEEDLKALRRIQAYVWQMNIDRGFDTEGLARKMLILSEEVGEVAKAVRKIEGLKFDKNTSESDLAEEIADVFIVLWA